jgi:3',5'-cyclic AMP phosphodiesterase CpdA
MTRAAFASMLLVIVALIAGCGGSTAPPGSTLSGTWVDVDGDGLLERGPGQPLLDRTELAPPARPGRTLATFAQVTDVHVMDAQSPARAPFLDRLGPPFESTFRPQETLTSQVLAATVRSLNRLPLDAVVETGDLVDNDQANEYSEALTVLRGGVVRPDSGRPGYEGVQAASDGDPFYYRPQIDAPRDPALLRRAERPFRSPGLRAPWFPVVGNHDVLVQGVIAPTARTEAIATGSLRAVGLAPDLQLPSESQLSDALVDRILAHGLPGPAVRTTPDARRREFSAGSAVHRLIAASGHGRLDGKLLDYSFDLGRSVCAIVLDAVRRQGGSGGTIRARQLVWLRRQLRAAGRRWVVVFTHQPLRGCAGGEQALALLDRNPRVVAAIAGDTHHNAIEPRRSPAGGYWLITTSSLVDYPQQARAFRLVATAGGGAAIETWMVDHGSGDGLARTSLALSFLDWQGGRARHFAGSRRDRNVRLFLSKRIPAAGGARQRSG